jgi:hypothetical protein
MLKTLLLRVATLGAAMVAESPKKVKSAHWGLRHADAMSLASEKSQAFPSISRRQTI